jgi:hypothetical protein
VFVPKTSCLQEKKADEERRRKIATEIELVQEAAADNDWQYWY